MSKKKKSKIQSATPVQDAFNSAWEKYRSLVPESEISDLVKSFSRSLCPSFRLNPLKTNLEEVYQIASRYDWNLEKILYCPEGFRIREYKILPGQTAEHRQGYFYIQDSASMLPGILFDQKLIEHHPLILDMAASPGGKTTHLISRSMDSGLVIANDSSASRIPALKMILRNWGSVNHAVTNFPGENFGSWFPETFDLILLDAPCSMQSLVSIDSHPMRSITEREELDLAKRQTALLDSAVRALRPGGQIVYSTCTLDPNEDEGVVNEILRRYGSQINLVDAQQKLPIPAEGLTEAYGISYDHSLSRTVRLWPHRYETAGFFAALIQKNDSIETTAEIAPAREWIKSGYTEFQEKDQAAFCAWFTDQLGCSVTDLISENGCRLWRRKDEIWAVPILYNDKFGTFPSKSIGMRMAVENSGGGWIPDNDWVSRFIGNISGNRLILNSDQESCWLTGEDLHGFDGKFEPKSIVLVQNENKIFLGCGKVSGDRIRNLTK